MTEGVCIIRVWFPLHATRTSVYYAPKTLNSDLISALSPPPPVDISYIRNTLTLFLGRYCGRRRT